MKSVLNRPAALKHLDGDLDKKKKKIPTQAIVF